jgi:hypothetical protein
MASIEKMVIVHNHLDGTREIIDLVPDGVIKGYDQAATDHDEEAVPDNNESNSEGSEAFEVPEEANLLSFEEAVREGELVFTKFESNVRAANLRLGEIAANVDSSKYGSKTLDKLGRELEAAVADKNWVGVFSDSGAMLKGDGAKDCMLARTLERNKSVWLAWDGAGIQAPAPTSWAVLRELQGHPRRKGLVEANPRMTKAKARELMQAWRASQEEPPKPDEDEQKQAAPPPTPTETPEAPPTSPSDPASATTAAVTTDQTITDPAESDEDGDGNNSGTPADELEVTTPPADLPAATPPSPDSDRRTQMERSYRKIYEFAQDILRNAIDPQNVPEANEACLREVMRAFPSYWDTIIESAIAWDTMCDYLTNLRRDEAPTREAE